MCCVIDGSLRSHPYMLCVVCVCLVAIVVFRFRLSCQCGVCVVLSACQRCVCVALSLCCTLSTASSSGRQWLDTYSSEHMHRSVSFY